MPKHSKGTPVEEIEEAAQRMRKHPEHLKAARNSKEWENWLLDIGILPKIVESDKGKKFWGDVRETIYPRPLQRRTIYSTAREAGMPAQLARRIRDWSPARAELEIESWLANY